MSATSHQDHLVNFELLKIARSNMGGFGKQAFVPGGDPSQGGGGGDPGADPTAGGAAAGGPQGPPPGGGGGADPTVMQLQQQVQQMQQQMQMGGGAGGAGMGAGGAGKNALTPKIDEKAVMLQMLKILARIADHLKIPIPASEMVVNQADMQGLAQASAGGGPLPGIDPTAGGGGQDQGGAISPIDPMQGMQPSGQPGAGDPTKQGAYRGNGTAFDSAGLGEMGNKAAAIARMRKVGR